MSSFQFPNNYGDPVAEGDALRRLITTVNPEIVFPATLALTADIRSVHTS